MKILLTGKNGQVGWELQRALAPLGEVIALGRERMDLSSPDVICAAIRDARPEVIVNAAAYTAVDRAETEQDLALRINGAAPGIMAEEAKRAGALLVHYSTDYVFDGAKDGWYVEGDRPNPLNAYGRSKLAGEEAIRGSGCHHLIFRTSWVYAARGSNFARTMLRLAGERPELRVVDDQVGAPTWARSIAEWTARALGTGQEGLAAARERSGLYHMTAAGAVSWHGFARALFEEAARQLPGFRAPALVPIPASQYPLPARRPANSRLSCARFTGAFGLTQPPWEEALRASLREIAGEG